jgi:hypothetical protein
MTTKLSIIIYIVLGLCVAYGYIAAGGWTEADTVGATLIAFVGVVMLRDQRRRNREHEAAWAARMRLQERLSTLNKPMRDALGSLVTFGVNDPLLSADELHGIELLFNALDAERDRATLNAEDV